MKHRTLIFAFITCLAGSAPADTIQSHSSIQNAAESFMLDKVRENYDREAGVKTGHLDSRLRLAECNAPLEAFQPDGGRTLGNTTVGVRCTGSQPWTLYVPVKVSIQESVVVAARPLQKGSRLKQQDLKLVERDLAVLRSGYYSNILEVLGKQISRTVNMGTAITTQMVKDPLQIKRGQIIDLIAKTGGLHVQMKGKALASGSNGERIQVRNMSTERLIEGVVLSATTVLVNM